MTEEESFTAYFHKKVVISTKDIFENLQTIEFTSPTM